MLTHYLESVRLNNFYNEKLILNASVSSNKLFRRFGMKLGSLKFNTSKYIEGQVSLFFKFRKNKFELKFNSII